MSTKKVFLINLKENADKIKDALAENSLQLAALDKLFRERNSMFIKLKKLLENNHLNEEEEQLMNLMIEDNRFILDKMEKIKQEMENAFHKKENDANKISKYSPDNLIG